MIRKDTRLQIAELPSQTASLKQVVNLLNYANYRALPVTVNFVRLSDNDTLHFMAIPEPSSAESVRLIWSVAPSPDICAAYVFKDLLIDRGSTVVEIPGKAERFDTSGITVVLPKISYVTSRRRMERYRAKLVRVNVSQKGREAQGVLSDFGGSFLRIQIGASDVAFFGKNNRRVQVSLSSGGKLVYCGNGVVKRGICGNGFGEVVIELLSRHLYEREALAGAATNSALVATCCHPLSGKTVRFRITKISYNTLAIQEDPAHAMLFAGLVIPTMGIDFGTGDLARGSAKVVGGKNGFWVLTITDMPVPDQRKLFSFLEKELGRISGIAISIDPDDLLKFLFETGFIYPDKYVGLAEAKTHLHEAFSRLYIERPPFSQHFIYDRNGTIEAHIALLRFYERSWLIHHHASSRSVAGTAVLEQIARYITRYSTMPSTCMEYLLFYFRPENRFPNRVFGTFYRFLNNRSLCSIDPLAYVWHDFKDGEHARSAVGMLEPATLEDLRKLTAFYSAASGGLMLEALDLQPPCASHGGLDAEYDKAGFKRQRVLLSLRSNGSASAVIAAVNSTEGLNMSGFTKCIHVFVMDETVPYDSIMAHLSTLAAFYGDDHVRVLFFPHSYPGSHNIPIEKTYNLFAFHTSVSEQFFEHTNRLLNRTERRRHGGVFPH